MAAEPGLVRRFCPCGKLSVLLKKSWTRELGCGFSCTPLCLRPLHCGLHYCTKKCHDGPCCSCTISNTKSRVKPATARNLEIQNNCDHRVDHCCSEEDQIGKIICNQLLSCGKHMCLSVRHPESACPPCGYVSFDEVPCNCGKTIIHPPVACGTKHNCFGTCAGPHNCNHPVEHRCDKYPDCPPCQKLTSKRCRCGLQIIRDIACHKQPSCGRRCKKLLQCSIHRCKRVCHSQREPSNATEQKCDMPCREKFVKCGHLKCQSGSTSDQTKCQQIVDVTCSCKRLKNTIECWKLEEKYEKLYKDYLEEFEEEAQYSGSGCDGWEAATRCKARFAFRLQCDEECIHHQRVEELRKQLSEMGQPPNYKPKKIPMHIRTPASTIHERLVTLISELEVVEVEDEDDDQNQNSRPSTLTYDFSPDVDLKWNEDLCRFVDSYSMHFGCLCDFKELETKAKEDKLRLKGKKRNKCTKVPVVTAIKGLSRLPPVNAFDVEVAHTANPENPAKLVKPSKAKKSEQPQRRAIIPGPFINFKKL